jgi:hypothetical protein
LFVFGSAKIGGCDFSPKIFLNLNS